MDLEFLSRVRRTSVITTLILYPVLATYLGIGFGTGWLIGCAWSLSNLHAIGLLVRALCTDGERQGLRITLLAVLKVPAFYAVGFLLLWIGWFPISALLVGFLWPFFVITMKALGRLALGMDRGSTTQRHKMVQRDA